MEGGTTFLGTLGEMFTQVITYIGQFVTALTSGSLSGLLPLFVIGIAISLAMVIMKLIRKVTWGS